MQQITVGDVTLEYEVRGSGEPVVLIHGALIAPTFKDMAADAALDRFKVIQYSRQGHAGSSRADGLLPIDKQADDCAALLRILDAVPAHVVGHSGGGIIAIEVARRHPEAVRTLSLLEPALIDVPGGAHLLEKFPSFFQAYQSGDKAGAVNSFLSAVCGDAYKDSLNAVPGSFEQAVSDSDTFFASEFPTFPMWSFTQEDARRMTMPVLSVMGANSDRVISSTMYSEIHSRVLDWFPNSRPFVLPGATHLLQFENPHDMAVGLAEFLKESSQS
jgi:pimeloyl-ACP methyl ester carboxylesterase